MAVWEPFFTTTTMLMLLLLFFCADFDFTQEKSVVFEINSDKNWASVSFVVPRDNIVELTEFFYLELRVNDSRIRTGRAMQISGVNNVDGKELLINT